MEINFFDAIVVAVILTSAYFAYLRGAVSEIMSVLSWVIAAIAAYLLAPSFVPVVDGIPVLGEYLSESCELSIIVAFTIVFAIALIVCSGATYLLKRLVSLPGVGSFDKGIGFVFGVVRGMIIVAVLLILHEAVFSGSQLLTNVTESYSATLFHDFQMRIHDQLPSNVTDQLTVIYKNITIVCDSAIVPEIDDMLPESPQEIEDSIDDDSVEG